MRSRRLRLALLASTALGLAAPPALAATEIGVTAAVNPMAHGTPPAQDSRVLRIGTDMTANEKVATGPRGQAQLLFLDGSALTVGPNSDIVLDEFVYDPETKDGELAFSATKGVFRLVGGHLSKRTPVTIRTPTATIGVRGGIALIQAGENGVEATFLFGDEMTVASGGVTETATRPGFTIQAPAGGAPNEPTPTDDDELGQTLSMLEGGDGQTGGVEIPPTDEDVAQTQIGDRNSVQANLPAGGGEPQGRVGGGGFPDPQREAIKGSEEERKGATAPGGGNAGSPPPDDGGPDNPPPPAGVDVAGALSGRFKIGGEGVGTSDGVQGLDVAFADGAVANSMFTGAGVTLPAADGAFSVPLTTLDGFGGVDYAGTGWLSPGRDFLIYELEDPIDHQRLLGFGGKPTPASAFPTSGFTAYEFRRDFVLGSDVPFIRTGAVGFDTAAPAKGYVDWSTGVFVMSKIVLEGQGPSQRSAASVFVGKAVDLGDPMTADLNGRFRGSSGSVFGTPRIFENGYGDAFALQRDGAGASFFGADGPDYFVLGNGDGVATESGGTPYNPNAVAQKTTGAQGTRTPGAISGFVGGLAHEFGQNPDVYAVTNRFNSPSDFNMTIDAATGTLSGQVELNDNSGGYGSLAVTFGGSGVGESAFFDDDTFAATEASDIQAVRGQANTGDYAFFMTTADGLELIGALPAGVSLCNCQYLRWGVLGMDLGDPDVATERTRLQMAGWVAGQISAQVDLPNIGLATYNGHVFGNVQNGADFYSAVGGLTIAFDFANPTSSTVNIANFDGESYVANVSNLQSSGLYDGNATSGGRFLNYKAAFFAGGGNAAAETGGQFSISGTAYKAAGIMAAKQTSFTPGN